MTFERRIMPGTLFFVHGTGVREAGYKNTLTDLQDGCDRLDLRVRVAGCSWGSELGVVTDRVDETLPPEVTTRAVSTVTASADPVEVAVAKWGLLLDDPLFELRVAAVDSVAQSVTIGGLSTGAEVSSMLEQ